MMLQDEELFTTQDW